MRLLILGGTTEASALARQLAGRSGIAPVLSLAGRTAAPVAPPVPYRVGGFGGVAGLETYLRAERIDAGVDAPHPFAARISAHAAQACASLRVPLVVLTRPPWVSVEGDRWSEVADAPAAVAVLGPVPRRVFLTVGRLSLPAFAAAPWHDYLVRTIDPPDPAEGLPPHRLLLARGPFSVEDECALLERERIDTVVSKNSGGAATYAKIEAARRLRLPVIMIARPAMPAVRVVADVDAVLAWIEAHRPAP
jgi:precorrin-6A/cobalt-precorrin-6A reductase